MYIYIYINIYIHICKAGNKRFRIAKCELLFWGHCESL